jgi:hypothetical protein
MALNTSTLETNLNTKMNATTGTTEGKEFLLLGKAVEALTPTVTVAAVVAEGTTQVGLVNTAGTTQVGLVNTAGSTQVAAVQAAATGYAPLADPTFTGVPAAPTAGAGTNTTQLATTAFVNGEVSALVASAPGTLDTLNELAAALNDDANFSTTVTNSIATKMPLAGGTFTGSVYYGDNIAAYFGASSDLVISHDGANSRIQDSGSGSLVLDGSAVYLRNSSGSKTYFQGVDGSFSKLMYDNSTKLETTSTGVDITGELIADSYNETYAAVTSTGNATTVDCHAGNSFSHTLTENTTFTFSNPPASGTAYTFSIEIIQDASASGFTVGWPVGIISWPAATAPTLTATASAKDIFVFTTRDGGTNWYGFTAGQALG